MYFFISVVHWRLSRAGEDAYNQLVSEVANIQADDQLTGEPGHVMDGDTSSYKF